MGNRISELVVGDLRQRQLLDSVQIALQIPAHQQQVIARTRDAVVYRFPAQHPVGDERQRSHHEDNNNGE
ncbi:hypothetical protein D3C73_1255880 [compost metagenome]